MNEFIHCARDCWCVILYRPDALPIMQINSVKAPM